MRALLLPLDVWLLQAATWAAAVAVSAAVRRLPASRATWPWFQTAAEHREDVARPTNQPSSHRRGPGPLSP
jgi:hypothetical protein